MPETISEGKLTMNKNHQPQGDTAKKGIERRKLLQMGLGALITAPFTSGIRPAVVRKAPVVIRVLTPDQAGDYLELYTNEGADPPLSILLSMLIHRGGVNYTRWAGVEWSQDQQAQRWHRFFCEARMHRILQAVISGEADDRVKDHLQHHLNKDGIGMRMTPLWRYFSGWLKLRILGCFDPAYLPDDREKLLISKHIDLEELIKLPLRDPYAEWP